MNFIIGYLIFSVFSLSWIIYKLHHSSIEGEFEDDDKKEGE